MQLFSPRCGNFRQDLTLRASYDSWGQPEEPRSCRCDAYLGVTDRPESSVCDKLLIRTSYQRALDTYHPGWLTFAQSATGVTADVIRSCQYWKHVFPGWLIVTHARATADKGYVLLDVYVNPCQTIYLITGVRWLYTVTVQVVSICGGRVDF